MRQLFIIGNYISNQVMLWKIMLVEEKILGLGSCVLTGKLESCIIEKKDTMQI